MIKDLDEGRLRKAEEEQQNRDMNGVTRESQEGERKVKKGKYVD